MSLKQVTVLVGSDPAAWFVEAIRRLADSESFEVTLVVDAREQGDASPRAEQSLARRILVKNPLVQAGKTYFVESPLRFVALEDVDILRDVPRVETQSIAETAYRVSLEDGVIDDVTQKSDVVVQYGMGILTGEILHAPEYGVVSYHHGDIRGYRGGPPGFWEFVHGEDRVGITVQRLTEELDGGEVLLIDHVDIDDAGSWPAVRQRLSDASPPLIVPALKRLADDSFTPEPPDQLGPIYRRQERGLKEYCMVIYRTLLE